MGPKGSDTYIYMKAGIPSGGVNIDYQKTGSVPTAG